MYIFWDIALIYDSMGVICVRLLAIRSAVFWVICGCWRWNAAAAHLVQLFEEATVQFILAAYFQHVGGFSCISDSCLSFQRFLRWDETLLYIYYNFDSGSLVVSLFLDFAKAFDYVDHEILLKKLCMYGRNGVALNWFKSYFADRKQFVSLNRHNSHFFSIKSGVPQGSIPGQLLFLIFINDFPKCSIFF